MEWRGPGLDALALGVGQERGLGPRGEMNIPLLDYLGQEADTRVHLDARDEAERRLVQRRAAGESGVLITVDQGIARHPVVVGGTGLEPVTSCL